jgi:putative oxidoreductase
MSLIRRIARPLLAASFISGGIDTLRNPAPKVPAAEKVVQPLVEKVPQLSNAEQVVKIDAGIKIVAGTMLALGKFPRLSAAALVASLVPTTAAGHRFWEESDPVKRRNQQLHFLKNAGIVGGLLLAAVDTEGRPSLAWRAQHAPRVISHAANDLRRDAELAMHSATSALTAGALRTAGEAVTGTLHSATDAVSGGLHSATDSLRSAAEGVRDRLPA